jgi:hypothetical protein
VIEGSLLALQSIKVWIKRTITYTYRIIVSRSNARNLNRTIVIVLRNQDPHSMICMRPLLKIQIHNGERDLCDSIHYNGRIQDFNIMGDSLS